MSWHPEAYLAFADERTRPAADLLARVPLTAPARIADLGCGPGNSTALLVQRWPAADVLGIDSSAAMLAEAEASGIAAGWQKCDLAAWTPDARCDLLFSNARCTGCPITPACYRGCSLTSGRAACWRCRCRATSRPSRTRCYAR
jgi:trans-aconitate methyltransferase